MIWDRRNPLDDPAVAVWDAAQGGMRATVDGFDEADVAMIESFLALDALPAPPARFVEQLGQQIAALGIPARSIENTKRTAAPPRTTRKGAWLVRADLASLWPRPRRRSLMWGALPLVAALLVVSLAVLYWADPSPSEPAVIPAAAVPKPTIEVMAQFAFSPPMWGMPDATTWTHMDFSVIELGPGKSYTTAPDWYVATDGPLVITVLSGELTLQPAGPAQFFPAPEARQSPVELDPGSSISLGPNETIVYSIADTAHGFNPGTVPMTALVGMTGIEHDLPGGGTFPSDVTTVDFHYIDGRDVCRTKGSTVSIQHLALKPFDSFVFDPGPNWQYLPASDPYLGTSVRIVDGVQDELTAHVRSRAIYSSSDIAYLSPGPHTIFNLSEETVDFYFFVVEPVPDAGTPPA